MSLLLAGSLLSLAAWLVLTFVAQLGSGAVHLLLAVGTTLFVAWVGRADRV
jgi:hypothetical protein